MRNYLTIDGQSMKDFGVYISGSGTFGAPERDIEKQEIPGKNGDVVFDNGRYKNRPLSYPAFIYENFGVNVEGLRNFLLTHSSNYYRIEDTYHPAEFILGRWTGSFEPTMEEDLKAGQFEFSFDCKPQRFLKAGEIATDMTASGNILNPSLQTAKPLLRVFGTGRFIIGDYTMTITAADEYTDIDCDIQEAYKGTTNCNGNVQGSYPELVPGTNLVTLDGVTRIIIYPRWWIL